MISAKTAARLRTIRSAGLSRVKAAATRQGIDTVERDMNILRAVATGSTVQAAERYGVRRQTVDALLVRYEQIAREILARDAVKHNIPG